MIEKFKNRSVQLIFALFCGLVYFGIALSAVSKYTLNGSLLLAFFFCPAIICGGALVIIKTVRLYIEEENKQKLGFLFWSHIVLAFVSATLAVAVFV